MKASSKDALGAGELPSLAKNSLAQFIAEGSVYAAALATSVITARALGPSVKGALSVLLFISHAILFWLVSFGVRDALVVIVGRGRASAHSALSVLLAPLLAAVAAGAGILWAISYPADWSGIRGSVTLAAVALAFIVYGDTAEAALNAHERLVATNVIRGTAAVLTAVFTFGFVVLLDGGITGAVAAVAAAQAVRLGAAASLVVRSVGVPRMSWNPELLRDLLKLGLPVALSYILIILSQRLDQLIVYVMDGEASAGIYSIALTMGQLVSYLAAALSASSFPRISRLTVDAAWELTYRVARVGMVGTFGMGLVLAVLIPVATAPIFGEDFRGAVAPAMVLLIGGMFWSQQWILARAAAASHRPRLLVTSFSANVAVMVTLDVLLVPRFGIMGAAIASVISALTGLALCLRWYRHQVPGFAIMRLVPRGRDIRETIQAATRLFPRRGDG